MPAAVPTNSRRELPHDWLPAYDIVMAVLLIVPLAIILWLVIGPVDVGSPSNVDDLPKTIPEMLNWVVWKSLARTSAICTLLALIFAFKGYMLIRRMWRPYCVVAAYVLLLFIPFGTISGLVTFKVLEAWPSEN